MSEALRRGSPLSELDIARIDDFCAHLEARDERRIEREVFWQVFGDSFPGRPQGADERRWLLAALEAAADRGVIALPNPRGKRWDRSRSPFLPTSVDRCVPDERAAPASWRTDPWPPSLAWVSGLASLSDREYEFLKRVHKGLVNDEFTEPAPLKYRSLALTGDEKRLAALAAGRMFAPGRLTMAALNCSAEQLPIAWEAVGPSTRAIVFENHASFTLALKTLRSMPEAPYGTIAFGSGRAVGQSLGWLARIGRPIMSIEYVGDLDWKGLLIATEANRAARVAQLPGVRPADMLHRGMLSAAAELGSPAGWPCSQQRPETSVDLFAWLSPDFRDPITRILEAGRRVPEEVLGPRQMALALRGRASLPE